MTKLTLLTAGAIGAILAGGAVASEENKVTTRLDLSGFDAIEVAGVYELDVRVGPEFSVELSGPDYEIERVEASVENGTLSLSQRKKNRRDKRRKWRDNREGVDAVITLPNLVSLDVSGVVEGIISEIDTESFRLEISGVGDIELDGECGTLTADVSGVGDLDADELECRRVDVQVSGVGDASVFASEEVRATVSGMGDIDVYGSPERVEKNNSMFAEITVH